MACAALPKRIGCFSLPAEEDIGPGLALPRWRMAASVRMGSVPTTAGSEAGAVKSITSVVGGGTYTGGAAKSKLIPRGGDEAGLVLLAADPIDILDAGVLTRGGLLVFGVLGGTAAEVAAGQAAGDAGATAAVLPMFEALS